MGAGGTCSFVGSHLDVVPANPETWEVDPFKLTVDGDKLFGRGTTDCLGHVAMIVRLRTHDLIAALKRSLGCGAGAPRRTCSARLRSSSRSWTSR